MECAIFVITHCKNDFVPDNTDIILSFLVATEKCSSVDSQCNDLLCIHLHPTAVPTTHFIF